MTILLVHSVSDQADGSLRGAATVSPFRSRVGCWMSMQPRSWPRVPKLTAQVAWSVAARGPYPLAMRVRDELGELFADAEFAEAFGTRGRPGWSSGQLALVTVLQFAENLTDRAAAHRVRYGMDFKYALGMELGNPGFDSSVLSEFRARLVEHGLEEKVLDLLLAALEALVCAAPGWLADAVPVREWSELYGPRIGSWHPPVSKTKREGTALVYGRDEVPRA
jgi:hypothetical protein